MRVVNKENAHEYVGKRVRVEIGCYRFGMGYPYGNTLVSFDGKTWVFKTQEELEDGHETWDFSEDDPDCSIEVFDWDDYVKVFGDDEAEYLED